MAEWEAIVEAHALGDNLGRIAVGQAARLHEWLRSQSPSSYPRISLTCHYQDVGSLNGRALLTRGRCRGAGAILDGTDPVSYFPTDPALRRRRGRSTRAASLPPANQ
jgi:hypothetical protein